MKLLQAAPACLITVVFSVAVCCRAEGAIPLDSKNFTDITKNCAGNYTQIEDFEARHIGSVLFPLCGNTSQTFSGDLHHGGGYRILNLNIDKPGGIAALFGIIDGARIDVIMQNSTVRGKDAATIAAEVRSNNSVNVVFYDGGVVVGEVFAGMMGIRVTGNGNSLVQTAGNNGTLSIEATGEDGRVGGFIASVDGDDNYFEQRGGIIDVKATRGSTFVGGMIVLFSGLNNTAIQNGTRLTAEGSFTGGGIQLIRSGSANNTLVQTNSSINVMGTLRAAGMIQRIDHSSHNTAVQSHGQIRVTGLDAAAGAMDSSSTSNNTVIQTDVQMNITATSPDGRASGGFILSGSAPDNTLIQTGNQMAISGKGGKVTALASLGSGSQGIQLLLYSGGLYADGNTPACDANEKAKGLIDIAGYNVDAQSCFDLEVMQLNSTLPGDWHYAQQEFCNLDPRARACSEEQETSCHYPHEQLQAVVHGNNALWLVTRQRYPFNPDSDRISPVRISRFLVNGGITQIDDTFNNNSALILPPNLLNTDALPDAQPVAQITDPDRLTLFYPLPEDDEGLFLACFPLSQEANNRSATYDTQIFTGLNGQPVLLNIEEENGYSLWMREQDEESDIVRRYQLDLSDPDPLFEAEYDLNNSTYPNTTVIGLGADPQWLYIALRNDTEIVVERINRVTSQRETWPAERAEVPVSVNSEGLAYRLLPEDNRLYFVPVPADAPLSETSVKPVAFNVEVPWFGGCAEWASHPLLSFVLYPLTSTATSMPTASPVPSNPAPNPDNPDYTGAIVGAVLGGGAVIVGAVVTGVTLIKYKKLKQAQCYLPSR